MALTSVSTLAPIEVGAAADVRARVQALPRGAASPLARLPGTHFGRWVVIDARDASVKSCAYLMFSATIDGDPDAYLGAVPKQIGAVADAVWGRCVGYPGPAERHPGEVAAYLSRRRMSTDLSFIPYKNATVDDVHTALATRAQLRAFAVTQQGAAPHEVLVAFTTAFTRVG